MYFKSIEFYGFKSFAERTILNFDSQIIAIVGPNGCGKSNIIDAVKWCLGEQSAHSLRSPQMSGVVFNGSQKRAPLNFAEVSLTFNNESKLLPIDYTEVTITRKLFRSGESEYYINKTQCRLKDIRDIFLDTGIGKEGYSIFEQGKVEFITGAKPEERMLLFEEAAGISKYKARREETLHKLEKVHKDMDVVNNITSVLKEQIAALESAVRKANLYKKYKEELRVLTIADLTQNIDKIDREISPLAASLDKANKSLLEKTTAIDKIEAEVSNLLVEKTNYDKNLNDVYVKLTQLTNEITRCEERINNSRERIKEFTQRKADLQLNIKDYDQDKRALEDKLLTISSDLKNHEAIVCECRANYDNKKHEFDKIKKEISEKQSQIGKLNDRIYEGVNKRAFTNNEIVRLNSEIDGIASGISVQNRELGKINFEKAQLKELTDKLNSDIDNLKQNISRAIEEYEDATSRLATYQNQIETNEREHKELEGKFYTLNSRLQTLKDMGGRKDISLHAVYHVMEKNFQGIHGTVRNILNISKFHEQLVSSYLGDKLNYIICENVVNAQSVIEYLEANKTGWVGFIVLDLLPDLHEKEFLGQLKGEKHLSSAVNYDPKWEKLVKFLFHNTYFFGNTVIQEAIMFGGSVDAGILPEPEIESKSIEKELSNTKELLASSEQKLKTEKKEILELAEIQRQKNNQLQNLNSDLTMLQKELKDKSERIDLSDIEFNAVQNQIAAMQNEQVKIKERIPALQHDMGETEKENDSFKTEIQKLESGIAEMEKLENQVNSELTELAKELSAREERFNSYERENATMDATLKQHREHFIQSENEIKSLSEKTLEQEEIHKLESGRINGLHDQKSVHDEEIAKLQEKENEIFKIIEKKQAVLNDLKEEFKNLQQEAHDFEMLYKTKEIERNNFSKQLSELNIEIEEVKKNYLNVEVNQEQISKLKRRIESVGDVNLTAQEQYTDLEKRHNFLLDQQQDLLKAEEDLRQAINKINSSIKEGFYNTFQQVRENFGKVFKQLFEGGEADIIVTDESNILESGIEIVAQPPGKKLQSLTLLSGGEKALTAIALLFAFYMVRPSPVCLLDEVDAPLDEANVTRFINLIKYLQQNSQFLIITHNKRTMEAADILYGVTMEEYGVSKIISMRLSKQQAAAEVEAETVTAG